MKLLVFFYFLLCQGCTTAFVRTDSKMVGPSLQMKHNSTLDKQIVLLLYVTVSSIVVVVCCSFLVGVRLIVGLVCCELNADCHGEDKRLCISCSFGDAIVCCSGRACSYTACLQSRSQY